MSDYPFVRQKIKEILANRRVNPRGSSIGATQSEIKELLEKEFGVQVSKRTVQSNIYALVSEGSIAEEDDPADKRRRTYFFKPKSRVIGVIRGPPLLDGIDSGIFTPPEGASVWDPWEGQRH